MKKDVNLGSIQSSGDRMALKAGVLYLIAEMLTRGISFLTTPVFTRLLPPAVFADAKIFEAWVYLIAPVISLSVYHSMARGKLDFDKDYGKFLSCILFLMVLLTVFVFAALLPAADYFAGLFGFTKPLLLLMLAYCLAYNGIQCIQLYDRQLLNYRRNIALTLLGVIPGVAISMSLVVAFRSSVTDEVLLLLRLVGFFLPTTILGLFVMGSVFAKERTFVNLEYWKYGISCAAPLMAVAVTSQLFFQSGNIFVRNIVGSNAAAIVAIAMTVGYIMDILIHALDNAWKPWMFEQLSTGHIRRVQEFWRFLLCTVALLILFLTLFAPELVLFLGGSRYMDAVPMIYPILCASLANFLMIGYTSLEQFLKQTRISGIASVLAAGVNLLLNYYMIKAFGYRAAAYTLLLAYGLACIIHCVFLRAYDKENILQNGFSFFVIICTVMLCAGSAMLYNLSFFARFGICLAAVLALGGLIHKKLLEILRSFLGK